MSVEIDIQEIKIMDALSTLSDKEIARGARSGREAGVPQRHDRPERRESEAFIP